MIDQFYSPRQVADRLSLSIDTVYRLCREGTLRSVRPAGSSRRLISESAILEFLDGEEGVKLAPVIELHGRR